mgnify:CR=1 FL=1
MIKSKKGYKIPVMLSVVCWLTFIWLRTFTYMADYDEGTGIYSFLISAVITLLGTFFYWSLFKPEENGSWFSFLFDDELDDYEEIPVGDVKRWCILRKPMFAVGSLAFLCLLAFVFEMLADITVFTDSTYITIGFFDINKKYVFDPILFIVFPLWTQMVFRGIREECYSTKSVLSGIVQMLMLSLISYLLFMKLPNIWLIELATVEIIIVIDAVRKYAWHCYKKKEILVALIGLYVLFWCTLLAMFYRAGMTFDQYSYGKNWGVYRNNVRQIVTGASAFGYSSELISNSAVTDFLADRNNYFLAGLYYGGWVVGVAIVTALLLFLVMSYQLLSKNAIFNRNYLVYKAAWWTLALRVLFGIPYSMGILPMPINLSFAGRIGFYMDTIALGLLIWSVIESKSIDDSFYDNKKISDMFEAAEIKIMDQNEDLLDLFKVVMACAGETTVVCFAEEYEEHNAMVLEPIDSGENYVFIVEKSADTHLWHDIEDDSVRNEILQKYMESNRPDCMEVVE